MFGVNDMLLKLMLLLTSIPVSLRLREVVGITSLPKQKPAACPSHMVMAALKISLHLLKYCFNLKEDESKYKVIPGEHELLSSGWLQRAA